MSGCQIVMVSLFRLTPKVSHNSLSKSVHWQGEGRVRFGSFHLMERPFGRPEAAIYDDHVEQIIAADELGFDWVWLTEHHFSSAPYVPEVKGEYCVSASPFAMACAVAR